MEQKSATELLERIDEETERRDLENLGLSFGLFLFGGITSLVPQLFGQ